MEISLTTNLVKSHPQCNVCNVSSSASIELLGFVSACVDSAFATKGMVHLKYIRQIVLWCKFLYMTSDFVELNLLPYRHSSGYLLNPRVAAVGGGGLIND